jgi:hypothetical protein
LAFGQLQCAGTFNLSATHGTLPTSTVPVSEAAMLERVKKSARHYLRQLSTRNIRLLGQKPPLPSKVAEHGTGRIVCHKQCSALAFRSVFSAFSR